jgi:hypothetical protein
MASLSIEMGYAEARPYIEAGATPCEWLQNPSPLFIERDLAPEWAQEIFAKGIPAIEAGDFVVFEKAKYNYPLTAEMADEGWTQVHHTVDMGQCPEWIEKWLDSESLALLRGEVKGRSFKSKKLRYAIHMWRSPEGETAQFYWAKLKLQGKYIPEG